MAIRKSKKLKNIITEKKRVDFTYTNLKGETKKRKNVEVVVQGNDKKGHSAIRAYEPGVGWRLFHSSQISNMKETGKTYNKTKQGYNPNDKGFKQVNLKTRKK